MARYKIFKVLGNRVISRRLQDGFTSEEELQMNDEIDY
jgi:hypothetical protein